MKRILPVLQLIAGLMLVILIVNDFTEAFIENYIGWEKIKIPIPYSEGGWDLKYWLMDHPGRDSAIPSFFSIYQAVFMATGLVLMLSALFSRMGSKLILAIVAGLGLSAAVVLIFPDMNEIFAQTPKPFMWAQILAAGSLSPVLISKSNNLNVKKSGIFIGLLLSAVLVIALLIHSPVTLLYALWPLLGLLFLFINQRKLST